MRQSVKIAAIQAEPVWLDLQGGVDRVVELIKEAGSNGTSVLGFPQLFIPGYPWSLWTEPPFAYAAEGVKYMENSLVKDSPEMERIRAAVKEARMVVVLGYSERHGHSLYQAQSTIGRDGQIINHRRKIKSTHAERTIFGEGHSEALQNVVDTEFGKVGSLVCWEQFQPLLRYYEYSQGVQVHVAQYPSAFEPHQGPINMMTAEASHNACSMMAMEGATFVLCATGIIKDENREKAGIHNAPEGKIPFFGFAQIFGPDGLPLAKSLGPKEEGILYAVVDLGTIPRAKHFLDVTGHYSRPDLLSLKAHVGAVKHVHHHTGIDV